MRRRWHIAGGLLVLALAGCRQSAMGWPCLAPSETIIAGPPHAAPEGMTWQLVPNGTQPTLTAPSDPSAACPAPARFGPPSTEPCPPKTVFVRGPQQKIIIERECEHQERKQQPLGAPGPEQPERAAAAIAAQQDVILVPRTVYVPYVAQAPTRAARLVTPVEAPAPLRQPGPEKPLQTPAPPTPPPLKTTVTEVCPEECPSECGPTTIIEIRQMHERMDRLQRLLERLTPGHRH
jgi:hypothetical protein